MTMNCKGCGGSGRSLMKILRRHCLQGLSTIMKDVMSNITGSAQAAIGSLDHANMQGLPPEAFRCV